MEDLNLNSELERQHNIQKIGADLHSMRTAKGISLATVAERTLISLRILKAIEMGDLAELPEPFYIRALVTKYARAIGAENIDLDAIDTPNNSPTSDRVVANSRKYLINFQLRSLHLYLIYLLLVGISVKAIAFLVERPVIINEVVPESVPRIENTTDASAPIPPNTQPKSLPQFVSQSTESNNVMVGINLQERCWLKVMVDGRLAFEGTLPKGTQKTWTGKEQVTIRAGNAGGVTIAFNNGPQKILGEPGKVEEVTYTVN